MRNIALISCVSKKLSDNAPAKDLYISPLFRLNLKYARQLSPTEIYVLSAKYGLVDLNEEIDPYDVTLNNMPARERKEWAQLVISQLKKQFDLDQIHFIILAGQKYRQYLLPHFKSYEIPLLGLTIGYQLQFLKSQTDHE